MYVDLGVAEHDWVGDCLVANPVKWCFLNQDSLGEGMGLQPLGTLFGHPSVVFDS